jgi:hypothetical protein
MGQLGRRAARGAISHPRRQGAGRQAVAAPVLTHRILTNFQAQSEGVASPAIITRLLEEIRGEQRRG